MSAHAIDLDALLDNALNEMEKDPVVEKAVKKPAVTAPTPASQSSSSAGNAADNSNMNELQKLLQTLAGAPDLMKQFSGS